VLRAGNTDHSINEACQWLNPDVGVREVQVMVVRKESWCEGRAAGVAGIRSGGCTVTLSDQLAVLATAVAG
jgi:hypothetical protein